ncbi:hypothetical protein [Streptomyces sp. NPDC048106]|uniref:hypothetical protein n=1 Tax=Streptomyces sp. NPDC048106 TaxID=3155750 RepID=UPI003451BF22
MDSSVDPGEDPRMERVIDLDQAAAEIAERRLGWERICLVIESVTWRDAAAPWPQALETDRGCVTAPDSMGLVLSGREEAALGVVLFCGGWADVDALTLAGDLVTEAPAVESPRAFGVLLDSCVTRVFGVSER